MQSVNWDNANASGKMQIMLISYSLMEDVERRRLIRVLLTFCEMFFPDRYFPASSTSKEKEKEEKTSQ